jgi:hypothetical protein
LKRPTRENLRLETLIELLHNPNSNRRVLKTRIDYFNRCCRTPLRSHLLVGYPLSHLGLDDISDQTPSPFNKGECIRKAAFQQYTDTVVARHVGCSNQSYVLSDAKVDQVVGFRQDEQVPRYRGFYLGEFLAEVFNEHIVHATTKLHGLLPDEFKALIERGKDLV